MMERGWGWVTDKVNLLLTGMGYNSAASAVAIANVTIASKQGVKVSVTATLPTMFSAAFASVFPVSNTSVLIRQVAVYTKLFLG